LIKKKLLRFTWTRRAPSHLVYTRRTHTGLRERAGHGKRRRAWRREEPAGPEWVNPRAVTRGVDRRVQSGVKRYRARITRIQGFVTLFL